MVWIGVILAILSVIGILYCPVIFILFLAFKLNNAIVLSWFQVFIPLIILICSIVVLIIVLAIQRWLTED